MYLSAGNILVRVEVGMLFIDFEKGHRLRLDGDASIDPGDPLPAGDRALDPVDRQVLAR